MEAYMLALIRGFLAAGDEVHIHTYDVDKKLAARLPVIIHRKKLFSLPGRWKKYCFLHLCNRHFDRKSYDLSLALTRTASAHIAVVGGVHPASVSMRQQRSHCIRRFYDRMETKFERNMFAQTPRILAHSKRIAGEISTYYPETDLKRITVGYPPIDTDFFTRVKDDELLQTKQRYQIDSAKMTLLFPSKGHRRKGLEELLAAFAQLNPKKFALLVAGEKMSGFVDIPAHVRYVGYVDNLSALYSAVDYTVLPSHYEPFGLAVVESLHCGTPVLVTRQVGAAELLHSGEGVVLESNSPEILAHAIEKSDKTRVPPGFVHRNGLSICQHIEKLKALVC